MTDFGLSGDYKVHDGLDQSEIFSPLLWRIFYDPFLCEVKRHKQSCKYRIDTKFVSKSGRIESSGGLTSYFLAGAFVNDIIWVGNCQASTQYALNIASEFFVINDISINSEKMVAIPINQSVKVASLSICGQPISIAKKGETHQYLGIFLSTKRLSKPSVAKAYTDVRFFINVVLRKAITDKQFSYLVSAVLQPIVSYHIQFSFVSANVCCKWNVLVRKSLRFKACLPHDFFDAALHYPSLYGLKPFEQVQSEGKVAALIMFSNAFGILGHLFRHRFLDLQIFGWAPLDPLQFLVRLCVSPVNNFLAGMGKIFLGNELSLVNNLPTAFRSPGHFPLSSILEKSLLDLRGLVPHWFLVSSEFLKSQVCLFSGSIGSAEKLGLDILESGEFSAVKDELHDIWSGFFEVFTNGSLKNTGSTEVACSAAAYFLVLGKSIGIAVSGLLSSTIAELQAVALALECVLSSSTVVLCLNSQAAIDTCVSEMFLVTPDFHNQCWLERHHIFNLVRDKDLSHSVISGNVEADLAVGAASGSSFSLCANVHEHFLVAEGVAVSGNAHHFVRNIFWSVCCARWEAGPGCDVVSDVMISCIDWVVMVPKDFTSLRSPIRQQKPLQTSSNLLDFLAENQSEHSETAANEENNSEITEEESIDSENEEDEMTTYITKIPEFNGEDIETSPQEWLDQITKAGDANGWNFENLATPFNNWNAFKAAFLEQFTNNNTSITLCNCFQNIKQEPSESVITYIEKFNKLLRQICQLETNNYYSDAQILDQFIAGLKDKLIKKIHPHAPEDLNSAIQHAKRYKMAMKEANHTKLVNLTIGETSSAAEEKIDQLTKKVETISPINNNSNPKDINHPKDKIKITLHHFPITSLKIAITVESLATGKEIAESYNETNKIKVINITLHHSNLIINCHYQFTIHQDPNIKITIISLSHSQSNSNTNNCPHNIIKYLLEDCLHRINSHHKTDTKPNHYHTQPSYLTMPEEQDFHHTAPSEGRAAAQQQNSSYTLITIPPARIAENANLSDIFPFEFEANESPSLLSNAAANKQKAITAMYTKAELKRNVNRPAQTVIITADDMKKTPVEEIDNFPFTLDGITILVKVLIMNAPQYQALVRNDWLQKANANLN
ncbi:hypothetical protein G9A89_002106 [Geosiphon pyriformis]|nr:hypothetical protein G9A89_002106 [Geosiphon pyriformis]